MLSIKNYYTHIIYLLVILIPSLLISGPFLPDLFLSISSLLFLYLVIKLKKFNIFFFDRIVIFLFFFLFYLVFSSIISDNKFYSLKSSMPYLRFVLFSLCLWFLLENYKNFEKNFLIIFIISILILLCDAYFQYFTGSNLFGIKKFDEARVSGLFGDELVLGSFLVRFYPFLVGLIIFNFQKDIKPLILFLFLSIVFLFGILISGEKAALALFIIAYLMMLFLFEIRIKNILLSGFLVFLIIIGLFTYDPVLKKRLVTEGLKNNENFKYLFSRTHSDHISSAIKMLKDKPFFGHGPNTFRKLCSNSEYIVSEHSCTTHPHNSYIQLLAETGIFGFLFLLFAFFYFLKKYMLKLCDILFSKYEKKKLSLNNFIEINFLINIFPLSTAGNFFNNWTCIIYYFPLGFYLYYRNKIKISAKI